MPETATQVREISFGDAVREAIAEEMRRDHSIVLIGEDVAKAGTTFKVLKGLVEEFGTGRIIDTPISEPGFTGIGVGAAMVGLRPIIEFMTWNFSLVAYDQLVNNAAKLRYMSNGQFMLPIVFRGKPPPEAKAAPVRVIAE